MSMRTRNEIEEKYKNSDFQFTRDNLSFEVLLDIRELLANPLVQVTDSGSTFGVEVIPCGEITNSSIEK